MFPQKSLSKGLANHADGTFYKQTLNKLFGASMYNLWLRKLGESNTALINFVREFRSSSLSHCLLHYFLTYKRRWFLLRAVRLADSSDGIPTARPILILKTWWQPGTVRGSPQRCHGSWHYVIAVNPAPQTNFHFHVQEQKALRAVGKRLRRGGNRVTAMEES